MTSTETSTENRSDTGTQGGTERQSASAWNGGECLDAEYERVLSCLQADGPRAPEALTGIVRGVLYRLETVASASDQQSPAEPQGQTVKPLSPRVWWRLTRPE